MPISDPVSITRAIEATPFSPAPNVVIAYPHFDDWKSLYKPGPLRMPDAQGLYRNVDAFESRYHDMKRDHEKHVLQNLDTIKHWTAGRAVFAALKGRPSYSVYILPYDFLPRDDWSVGNGAVTEPLTLPQSEMERARGIKPQGTICSRGACWTPERQTSMSVDVFYTARRFRERDADGALLHELVHAIRYIWGVSRTVPMGGGYGEVEEFYANTIEMIYRSEKRLPIYDYHHHPFDAASFLEKFGARALLSDLRVEQQSLFLALAKVEAGFNPIKQIEGERQKLIDDYAAAHPQ